MIYSNINSVNRHVGNFVFETMNALPAQERMEFKRKANAVLAPKGDPKEQASLMNYLYRAILKASADGTDANSMYAFASKSKGDITKMEDWKIVVDCSDSLNDLYDRSDIEIRAPMKTANDLLQMLKAEKKNFEYGFKYNIEILKVIYCYLVEAYYELLDAASMYISVYYRPSPRPYHKFVSSMRKDTIVVTNVNMILDMYKNGEWAKFMKQIQNSKVAASESFCFSGESGTFTIATQKEDPFVALEGGSIFEDILGFAGVGIVSVGVIITIFYAIRGLIAYFFRKSNSYKNYLENQARLLDIIASNDDTMTEDQKEKILRKKDKMTALGASIERKILKADKEAKEDMKKESVNISKAIADSGAAVNVGVASTASPAPNTSDDGLVIL